MAPRPRQPLYPRLENDAHEQFARCLALGNDVLVCYYGVGYPMDEQAALSLAKTEPIKLRAEEWYRHMRPKSYANLGYKYPHV